MIVLSRLVRDTRGAAIVEMAMVAPVLVSLVVGAVDLSRGYLRKLELQQIAQQSIEKISSGQLSVSSEADVQASIAVSENIQSSDVKVDLRTECDGRILLDDHGRCNEDSISARFVSVRIKGDYRPIFPARFNGANVDGSYTLYGRAGVRIQ